MSRAHRHVLRAFMLLLAVLLFGACVERKPTLIVLVGGAGLSQLGDLDAAITAVCPDAEVVEAGGWDGFRADLKGLIKRQPREAVILIGHSFGCKTIADVAADLPMVDLAVMIDPAWDDITLPRSIASCHWYQRSDPGMERRAKLTNAGRPTVIAGGHNDICHSPRLIAEVSRAAKRISERTATRARMRKAMFPGG